VTRSFSVIPDQIPARLLSLRERSGHMMTAESLSTISTLLSSAQTVCIFFPAKASADTILSAVSFGKGLQALGKNVTVSSPGPVAERLQQFSGVGEVSKELGNKNLDVSFPYSEEQVDKVSYHIDEETKTFHLVVQPRRGAKPLDSSLVTYTLSGADADLIFTFGVDRLEDLDQLYIGYEQLFEQTSIVSVHTFDTPFGTVKVNTSGAASYAEVVAYLLQELGVELGEEVSTTLLAAIESATQTFKSLAVTAQTFEIAGKLLVMGARRVRIQEEHAPRQASSQDGMTKKFIPVTPKEAPITEKTKVKHKPDQVPRNPGVRLV